MNKVVILGCGYIGTNIANYCASNLEDKVKVIGIDNYYVSQLNNKIQFVELKTENINMQHIDIFEDSIVIDATGASNATTSISEAGISCLENCINKIKLINTLQNLKVKKYIYLSSGGTIYGDSETKHQEDEKNNPLNIYALEKVIMEQFLKINSIENKQFDYLILRLANPYGGVISPDKKQGIIDVAIDKAIKNEILELYGDIDNIRDYIYIDELGEAVYKLAILNNTNEIYNIGTGIGNSIKEIFEEIEKQYNTKINIKYTPIKTANIKKNVLDIEKMYNAIKFRPKIGISQGIELIKQQRN